MRTDCVCQSKLCVYQSNGHKDTFFGRIDTSFRIDGNVEMRDRARLFAEKRDWFSGYLKFVNEIPTRRSGRTTELLSLVLCRRQAELFGKAF